MSSGQRFDTAEIDVTKPAAEKRRRRKNRHKKPEGRVPRWVYRIILILILCVVSMLLWLNRSNLAPANVMEWVQTQVVGMGIGDGYPYPIVGSTVSPGNFKSVNRQLVMLRDTELTELNSTAKEILRRQHSYSKPVLKINGLRSLIYNLGGKGYQIESQSGTLVKANAQQNIFAGGLASNGRFALLTEADGYFGCLTAYSADNQVLFHYWFSDCYPTAVALNPEGTQAVVTGVSAKDGGLTSSVYLLDFGSSKTVAPVAAYKENMLMDASWAENGMAIAIGDKMASVIDTVTRKKTDYDYQGLLLTAYTMDTGRAVLSLSPYQNAAESKLVLLDTSGKAAVSAELKQSVSSVSLFGSTMAALGGEKVSFYSAETGALLGTGSAGSDAQAIALCDENSAYVLGLSEIRLSGKK